MFHTSFIISLVFYCCSQVVCTRLLVVCTFAVFSWWCLIVNSWHENNVRWFNTIIVTNTQRHTPVPNCSTKSRPKFSYTSLERANHQYLNGQHLACEVRTGMYVTLTESRTSFIYKMIREIISMPRAEPGYPHNFGVNSLVFKDDKYKTEAKTNSGHRVCQFLVRSPLLACIEHSQCPLLAYRVSIHSHTYICNFFTKSAPEFCYTFYWKGRTIQIWMVNT